MIFVTCECVCVYAYAFVALTNEVEDCQKPLGGRLVDREGGAINRAKKRTVEITLFKITAKAENRKIKCCTVIKKKSGAYFQRKPIPMEGGGG